MTTTAWRARVTATAVDPPSAAAVEQLREHIPGDIDHDAATRRLTVTWRLDAHDLAAAAQRAIDTAATALRAAFGTSGPSPSGVDLVTATEADLPTPAPGLLMGTREIANEFHLTTARVTQLAKKPGFPRPVERLAAGPVYTRESILAWKAAADSAPPNLGGRPRKDR